LELIGARYQRGFSTSGQFLDALDAVRVEILESYGDLMDSGTEEEGETEGRRIKNLYKQAILDALANQPAVWATGATKLPDLSGGTAALTKEHVLEISNRAENLAEGKEPDEPRKNLRFTPQPEQRGTGTGARQPGTDADQAETIAGPSRTSRHGGTATNTSGTTVGESAKMGEEHGDDDEPGH
jgi:hypothetical protein